MKPNYWIGRLAMRPVAEFGDTRCWAAFILTGYGLKPSYGDGTEPDAIVGADRNHGIQEGNYM